MIKYIIISIIVLICFMSKAMSVTHGKTISEGDDAPSFIAQSTKGEINLLELRGSYVVLYFYPKDMTPGCTIQAQDFSCEYDKFQKNNVHIIGISRDTLESHIKFQNKYSIPYPLISDPEGKICSLYQALGEKTLFGKKYIGITRTTILIDPKGKIVNIMRKVSPKGHVDAVLKKIESKN